MFRELQVEVPTVRTPLPPRWIEQSLVELLTTVLCETGAIGGVIRRPGFTDLIVDRRHPPLQLVTCAGGATNPRLAPSGAYRRDLGPVTLVFEDPAQAALLTTEREKSITDEVALLMLRHRIAVQAEPQVKTDLSSILVGGSEGLCQLWEDIGKVARTDLPVAIEAEFASGEMAVAAAIHCLSARQAAPFVVLQSACQQAGAFYGNLCAAVAEAEGGSLFLHEVDGLDRAMQKDLLAALTANGGDNVRILSSSSRALEELVRAGGFCPHLFAHLDLLHIQAPPLRGRRADIRPLVEYEVRERLHSSKNLSEEVLAACEAYGWPENLNELKRTIARLVVMSDGNEVGVADLEVHAAAVARGWAEMGVASPELDADGARAIEDLARNLVGGRRSDLSQYGMRLERALTYLSEHYLTDLSLGELASKAYLSPSHLSYLFKKMLGAPFKTLLAAMRIERAKALLLRETSSSVTEVSLDSGFCDLSHFEKTFKRFTGMNPREFRRRGRSA